MTYDLSRFSTQSFERFAQSLAIQHFGPSTQIYGAGADGAREATFEGQFKGLPTSEADRDGYVVVQAKYRKVPISAKDDLSWLKEQADAELRKFTNPSRKLRAPEYYVFVTNIVLTPGAENSKGRRGGTLDQMISHMETWKTTLGVKEVFLWHADVLSAFLDIHSELRTSFAGWVTPSDVLSAALKTFRAPDFATVLNRVVRDELKDQRGIKTQDSGQSHGQPVYIDDVFVDLPLNPSSLYHQLGFAVHNVEQHELDEDEDSEDVEPDEPDEDEDDGLGEWVAAPNWNIVNHVMEKLSDKLDPLQTPTSGRHRRSPYHRVVVLGGPGQGKSTIGQFLSQLLRARLVQASGRVPPEVGSVAAATIARAQAENIDLSGPLRFPIHIVLPRYADILSKGGDDTPSLLRYAATHFSKISDEEVDPKLLRDWIQHYPSLIVLDGLDEVPRTGNRADVIRAIERLVADIHEAGADSLLLVTSRPQGYLNDLDREAWAHWSLADLDQPNAIRFAARLGEVLISEAARRSEVLATLTEAAADASTAPLMISPLQISLLFSLVITRNDIPKDRWTLFERHYEILRDREIAKGGSTGDLIRDHRSEIDRIHFDAGFILQVRAEKEGNASAHFTPGEFKELIIRNLTDSILDAAEIEVVAERIKSIATTRLVFLGDRNEGRIAFDVRSLQEFMAAARIMVSPEALIRARLTEIALKSHWAHVFRIACSKVYALAGLQELREDILEILDKLDGGDVGPDYREIRAGARLAIGLLSDSTAGARQTDKAKLMARAVRVMEIDNAESIGSLADVADTVTLQTLNRVIDENLQNKGGPLYLNSVRLLVTLSRRAHHHLAPWALAKLREMDPINVADKAALVDLPMPAKSSQEAKEFFHEILWAAGPSNWRKWPRRGSVDISGFGGAAIDHLNAREKTVPIRHEGKIVPGVSIVFCGLSALQESTMIPPSSLPRSVGWHVISAAIEFSKAPSAESLAGVLDAADGVDLRDLPILELPWPVAGCLAAVHRGAATAGDLAARVRGGAQGGPADWRSAEESWLAGGVELRYAAHPNLSQLDLSDLGAKGPPARKIRRENPAKKAFSLLLNTSANWSLEARSEALPLLCFLADDAMQAKAIIEWISDDLLAQNWSPLTTRRVVGIIQLALSKSADTTTVERLIAKVPGNTQPVPQPHSWSEALVNMLGDHDKAEWAATAMYSCLPLRAKISGELDDLDARYLVTPKAASPQVGRAYAAIRAVADRADRDRVAEDAEALAAISEDQPFSTVLRKIYKGQRESDALERLTCGAAQLGLQKGYRDRHVLIQIVAELIASRESNLDDDACLQELGLPPDVRRENELEAIE